MTYERDFPAFLVGNGITRFTAAELCQAGRVAGRAVLQAPPCDLWANIIPTARVAQEAREAFGQPMIVNSGYRDPLYNQAVGGALESMHIYFRAMDVRIPGVEPSTLYEWFDAHPDADTFGLGLYPSFVHIDTRGRRARF